jgi:hypothetical protein
MDYARPTTTPSSDRQAQLVVYSGIRPGERGLVGLN